MGSGPSALGSSRSKPILTEAQAVVLIQTLIRIQQSKKRALALRKQKQIHLQEENSKRIKLRELNGILTKNHNEAALRIQVFIHTRIFDEIVLPVHLFIFYCALDISIWVFSFHL